MPSRRSSVQLLALSAIGATAAPVERRASAPEPRAAADACYTVDNVGTFNTHLSIDFTTLSELPSSLTADTYTVGAGTAPYSRQFSTSNIILEEGSPLQMIVPGNQSTSPISSAQMTTAFDDVLYASVRTTAKASDVAGAIHGFFMYKDDNQETDIEIRTSEQSLVHFTNQQAYPGVGETTYNATAPSDMATAFHEYRYDWLEDRCDFYIDSVLLATFTTNVPTYAGYLMWNQWSNGNTWSEGPPLTDSILEIQSIEAYFNRTSSSCDSSSSSSASSSSATASATSSVVSLTSSTTAVSSTTAASSTPTSSSTTAVSSTTTVSSTPTATSTTAKSSTTTASSTTTKSSTTTSKSSTTSSSTTSASKSSSTSSTTLKTSTTSSKTTTTSAAAATTAVSKMIQMHVNAHAVKPVA